MQIVQKSTNKEYVWNILYEKLLFPLSPCVGFYSGAAVKKKGLAAAILNIVFQRQGQ